MKNYATALAVIVSMLASSIPSGQGLQAHSFKSHDKEFDQVADYVVVGLGGAGCVLARRLTDDKKTSVIGIEAGSNDIDQEPISDPSVNGELDHGYSPQYFWQGATIPQTQLEDQTFHWTNGRIFGGGLSINGLQFVRGTPELWQQYEDALGDDWAVDQVFRRYKELEKYVGPTLHPLNRGTEGHWVTTALPEHPTEDAHYILEGFEQVSGLPEVIDVNDQYEGSIGPFLRWDLQIDPNTGLRTSTATGFLGPDVMTKEGKGRKKRKLKVHFESTVLSLIWDDKGENKVIGVRYTRHGKSYSVRAKKAVILSAGFQTAQLLQTEGIGPREVLEAANIPVRVDNYHVGKHLTNHPLILGIVFSTPGLSVVHDEHDLYSYYTPGAFLPDTSLAGNPETRGFQWITMPTSGGGGHGGGGHAMHGSEGDEDAKLALIPLLLFPKSEGTVKVQNPDPLKIALVDVSYLSDPADLESFKAALRHVVLGLDDYFASTTAPSGGHWSLENPSREVIEDDELLTEFIKTNIEQAHHWSATTRMAKSGAEGVVDPQGRVFGVQGLRVADNSILNTTDGNLGGPAVLVGWTIAEFLINEDAMQASCVQETQQKTKKQAKKSKNG